MPSFPFRRDNPVVAAGKLKAQFIKPMECRPVAKLPEGAVSTWEIKLDGWRMEAVKTGGRVTLYSRGVKTSMRNSDTSRGSLNIFPMKQLSMENWSP
jgi:hypothetical protein